MWIPGGPLAALSLSGIASNTVDSGNPILSWVSYGAVGVVAIAFFMDWIVSGKSYHRVEKQLDAVLEELAKERDKNTALQGTVIGTALPEIAKSAALLESMTQVMERVISRLDQLERIQSRRDQ